MTKYLYLTLTALDENENFIIFHRLL